MMNEAVYYAQQDKTAYITLQEGVEHSNYDDQQAAQRTLKSSFHKISHENCYESLLNRRTLKLEMQKYGYAPITKSILPGTFQKAFIDDKALKPLFGHM